MTAIYDEIPKSLEKGKEYTQRELVDFLQEHSDVIIISKTRSCFGRYSGDKIKIIDVFDSYIHYSESRTYCYKNTTNMIYIVE